jgi:hypothetical protein
VWVQVNEHAEPHADSPRGLEIACTFKKDEADHWVLNTDTEHAFTMSSKDPKDHSRRSYVDIAVEGDTFTPVDTYQLELTDDDYRRAVDFSQAINAGFHAADKAI